MILSKWSQKIVFLLVICEGTRGVQFSNSEKRRYRVLVGGIFLLPNEMLQTPTNIDALSVFINNMIKLLSG